MNKTVPILAFLLVSTPSFAQDGGLAAKVKEISDRYNECVYTSAISQFKPGAPAANDVNRIAEYAFGSCATENEQMIFLMRENGFSAVQMQAVLLDKKTGIKRELRKLILEAQGIK